jgi:hypothetical protein
MEDLKMAVNECNYNRYQVLVDGNWEASFKSFSEAREFEDECERSGIQPELIKLETVEAGQPWQDVSDPGNMEA